MIFPSFNSCRQQLAGGALLWRFRLLALAAEPVIFFLYALPSPALVEMLGYAGFDFLVLDTEHGAAGVEMLEHQLRAADSATKLAIVAPLVSTPPKSSGNSNSCRSQSMATCSRRAANGEDAQA